MEYHLFTDGACQPNPGQGGWAFLVYPENEPHKKETRAGFEESSTNNRMEITAVLEGIKFTTNKMEEEDSILLCSDSKYIIQGIDNWMHAWQKNNWKRINSNKPLLNLDLWKQIYALIHQISVKCKHVPGHSGHLENEECDNLATQQIALHN